MNRWAYEQIAMAHREEMRTESVVCPKPRRLVLPTPPDNDPIRPYRWPINRAKTGSKAGVELLDIILSKEKYGENCSNQVGVATSPPFFGGSPPSRASNPVVQDEQFGNGNGYQFCEGPASPSPTPLSRKGSHVRMKFGHRPAAVRVEGFDCLNRDARNCSISAVA